MTELEGTKLTYDCASDKWNVDSCTIVIEPQPFQEGGMRMAYKAREVFADGSDMEVVLKHFKEEVLEEENKK